MSSINGTTQTSTDFNFLIVPLKKGRYIIDPTNVNVNGVDHSTGTHRLEVVSAMTVQRTQPRNPWGMLPGGNPGFYPPPQRTTQRRPRGEDVVLEAELGPETVYVHEPTIYKFRFLTAVQLLSSPKRPPISPTGFVSVALDQEVVEENRQGRDYLVTESSTALFPLSEGEFTIPAFEIPMSSGIFGATKILRTEDKTVTVLPLPTEGQPLSFTGAVGEWFDMQASLSKTQIQAGQTVELKVEVEGEGHLDLVPYPHIPDWDGVDKRQLDGGSMVEVKPNGRIQSRRTYLFRLKFKKPGTFKLDEIAFAYFRPGREHYEVLKAPEMTVQVSLGEGMVDETDGGASGLVEKERPAESPGSRDSSNAHIPVTHFAGALSLAVLALLIGSFKSGPNLGHFGSVFSRRGRPKNLAQLEEAMRRLAPGADSLKRQTQLAAAGWNDAAVRRFEELRRKVSSLQFGAEANQGTSEAQIISEFVALQKEAKQ